MVNQIEVYIAIYRAKNATERFPKHKNTVQKGTSDNISLPLVALYQNKNVRNEPEYSVSSNILIALSLGIVRGKNIEFYLLEALVSHATKKYPKENHSIKHNVDHNTDQIDDQNRDIEHYIGPQYFVENKLISCLIKSKCQFNQTNNQKENILICATYRNNIELISFLIASDICDKNMLETQDMLGYTALMNALCRPNIYYKIIEILVWISVKKNCRFDLKDKNGNIALGLATQNKNLKIVELIFKAHELTKSSVNILNNNGETILTLSVLNHQWPEDTEFLKILINLYVRHGGSLDIVDNKGKNALLWAITDSRCDIAKLLIDAGCDKNIIDKNGRTALIWAVMSNKFDVAKLLIEAGCDKNIVDREGKTALDIATKNNNYRIIYLLRQNHNHRIVNLLKKN